MSSIHITFRRPRPQTNHWIVMMVASFVLHAVVATAGLVLPRLLPSSKRFPGVYVVDMVSLPAGLPGPPARGPRAVAPAPPKPAPKKKAAPVKIPEKPKKSIEKKPVKKKEAPKPVPEKKPEPIPEPESTPEDLPPPSEAEGPQPQEVPGDETDSAPSPGGVGFGDGTGVGGGGSGRLDDASFEYAWYLNRMVAMLRNNWARPLASSRLRTVLRSVVYFRIRRDGTLADVHLEESSGDSTLDASALRAVRDSNPLPPLPYQYGKDSLGVHFYFELEPD